MYMTHSHIEYSELCRVGPMLLRNSMLTKATVRLRQHCAAISAIAEFLWTYVTTTCNQARLRASSSIASRI